MPHYRIVHEDIDAADAPEQVRHRGLDGGALREIGGDADDLDAEFRAKLVSRRGRFYQIVQDNVGARTGQAFRHGQPKAGRCAGDECPLALQHRIALPDYFFWSSSANTSLALRKASTP